LLDSGGQMSSRLEFAKMVAAQSMASR
jgi:hypothetical protein